MRLSELAEHLGARVLGDPEREVVGVRPLDEAGPEHLSFLTNPRYGAAAVASRAGAILVGPGEEQQLEGRDLLQCEEPYLAFARVLELFHPPVGRRPASIPRRFSGTGCGSGTGSPSAPWRCWGMASGWGHGPWSVPAACSAPRPRLETIVSCTRTS